MHLRALVMFYFFSFKLNEHFFLRCTCMKFIGHLKYTQKKHLIRLLTEAFKLYSYFCGTFLVYTKPTTKCMKKGSVLFYFIFFCFLLIFNPFESHTFNILCHHLGCVYFYCPPILMPQYLQALKKGYEFSNRHVNNDKEKNSHLDVFHLITLVILCESFLCTSNKKKEVIPLLTMIQQQNFKHLFLFALWMVMSYVLIFCHKS